MWLDSHNIPPIIDTSLSYRRNGKKLIFQTLPYKNFFCWLAQKNLTEFHRLSPSATPIQMVYLKGYFTSKVFLTKIKTKITILLKEKKTILLRSSGVSAKFWISFVVDVPVFFVQNPLRPVDNLTNKFKMHCFEGMHKNVGHFVDKMMIRLKVK